MNYVLIDSDEDQLYELYHLMQLTQPGVIFSPFVDSLLAAKYIWNNSVDIVFSKVDIQPADGYELLKNVRKLKPRLPFILLVDKVPDPNGPYPMADGYMIEPISAEQIRKVIRALKKR